MYATVNKIANIVSFIKRTFVKETSYPIISILLFILVIIVNSIQYSNNDKNYIQYNIQRSISTDKNNLSLQNSLLYLYDFISINGFMYNGLIYILFYILTYFCLSLIELNIGHISLLFLLLIGIMFQLSWGGFQDAICANSLYSNSRSLLSSPYCCGSFVLFMSLGFVLYLIQKNINNWGIRSLILFVILCTWIGCILYDYYSKFSYGDDKDGPQKTCKSFNWHAANFVFGIFCGVTLAN
jgi:hypothetical protein